MAMVAPLVAALGFSSPDSKLLALRGGVKTDTLLSSFEVLNILVGMQGWLAPKSTMEQYGPKDISDEESAYLRCLSSFNVVAGVTMVAAETDLKSAYSTALLAWALATSANTAVLEKLDVPKGPIVGTIALFGAVGELARQGKIDAEIAGYFLLFGLIPLSIGEIISPQTTLDAFGMKQPSALTKSLFENFAFTKLNTGMFLLITKLTGKKGLGLAAFAAGNFVNTIKTLTRAKKVGLAPPGLAVWSVLSGAIGLLAYKNEA
jgi:hypothetical protein